MAAFRALKGSKCLQRSVRGTHFSGCSRRTETWMRRGAMVAHCSGTEPKFRFVSPTISTRYNEAALGNWPNFTRPRPSKPVFQRISALLQLEVGCPERLLVIESTSCAARSLGRDCGRNQEPRNPAFFRALHAKILETTLVHRCTLPIVSADLPRNSQADGNRRCRHVRCA